MTELRSSAWSTIATTISPVVHATRRRYCAPSAAPSRAAKTVRLNWNHLAPISLLSVKVENGYWVFSWAQLASFTFSYSQEIGAEFNSIRTNATKERSFAFIGGLSHLRTTLAIPKSQKHSPMGSDHTPAWSHAQGRARNASGLVDKAPIVNPATPQTARGRSRHC